MVSLGLEEKVIVVTGGNRGIGAAIVSLLIELGAKVAYTDLATDNPQGLGIVADVTKLESMEAAAKQIEALEELWDSPVSWIVDENQNYKSFTLTDSSLPIPCCTSACPYK